MFALSRTYYILTTQRTPCEKDILIHSVTTISKNVNSDSDILKRYRQIIIISYTQTA